MSRFTIIHLHNNKQSIGIMCSQSHANIRILLLVNGTCVIMVSNMKWSYICPSKNGFNFQKLTCTNIPDFSRNNPHILTGETMYYKFLSLKYWLVDKIMTNVTSTSALYMGVEKGVEKSGCSWYVDIHFVCWVCT